MTVVGRFGSGGGGVAGAVGDGAVEAPVVEPVEVGHRGELDVVEASPGALSVDELPLVEPVEALGEGVVDAPIEVKWFYAAEASSFDTLPDLPKPRVHKNGATPVVSSANQRSTRFSQEQ